MPYADHGPTRDEGEAGRRPPPQSHIRLALLLFAIYLALYGAFVLLNAFASQVMERKFAGINLAVWYGFALIIAAFALALVYGYLCRSSAAITAREHR